MEGKGSDGLVGEFREPQNFWCFAMNVGMPLGGGDSPTGGESEVRLVKEEI